MLLCEGKALPSKDGDWGRSVFTPSTSCSTPECSLQKLSVLLLPSLSCSRGGGSLLSSFRCSGPNYYLYCTKGNILGDSWAHCQAPGPPVFSASPKRRSGAWSWCNGKWQSAFSAPETFFPSLPRGDSTQEISVYKILPVADIRLIYY